MGRIKKAWQLTGLISTLALTILLPSLTHYGFCSFLIASNHSRFSPRWTFFVGVNDRSARQPLNSTVQRPHRPRSKGGARRMAAVSVPARRDVSPTGNGMMRRLPDGVFHPRCSRSLARDCRYAVMVTRRSCAAGRSSMVAFHLDHGLSRVSNFLSATRSGNWRSTVDPERVGRSWFGAYINVWLKASE